MLETGASWQLLEQSVHIHPTYGEALPSLVRLLIEEDSPMTTNLQVGDRFPEFELPNHDNQLTKLSQFTQPSLMDKKLRFLDGYPLILVFYRGFFCPRDRQQLWQLVQFQGELAVNYCKLVTVSVDAPLVQAAFRAGLGAQWSFLSDEKREIIKQIKILDETEGEYAYRAQPYTFVLRPDLTIHKLYNGWFFVGRPTIEELRLDLRAIMEARSDYRYEAYNTPEVRQIRIPQQEWFDGAPTLGANGLPIARGVVRWFDVQAGSGAIARDDGGDDVFFNFTAIPGEGYRTLTPGTSVKFELVESKLGSTARNVQKEREEPRNVSF
jgi:cold shock CspA family protein/peroxiredoxin